MRKIPAIPPAQGASVQAEPRLPIVQMLAPESEKDFEQSLPDSTAQPSVEKRKRRSKEEMAAARGEATPGVAPVTDPRLERAKAKFTSLGAGNAIKAGFIAAKKPLDSSEQSDVDDYFYLIGTKGGLDPTKSWVAMFFCAFLLIARLVFVRTDLGDHLKAFFFPPVKPAKEEEEADERGATESKS